MLFCSYSVKLFIKIVDKQVNNSTPPQKVIHIHNFWNYILKKNCLKFRTMKRLRFFFFLIALSSQSSNKVQKTKIKIFKSTGHCQTISKNWFSGRYTSNKRLNQLFRRKNKLFSWRERTPTNCAYIDTRMPLVC